MGELAVVRRCCSSRLTIDMELLWSPANESVEVLSTEEVGVSEMKTLSFCCASPIKYPPKGVQILLQLSGRCWRWCISTFHPQAEGPS